MNVRRSLFVLCVAGSSLAGAQTPSSPSRAPKSPEYALTHQEILPLEKQNYAYRWLNIAEETTAREVDRTAARPTILSRTLQIWANAMYDAWAAYDDKAVGTRLSGKLRRPAEERTIANKN